MPITIEIDEALRAEIAGSYDLYEKSLEKLTAALKEIGLKETYREQLDVVRQYGAILEKLQSGSSVQLSDDEVNLLGREEEMLVHGVVSHIGFRIRTDVAEERDGSREKAIGLDGGIHEILIFFAAIRDAVDFTIAPETPLGKLITAQRPGWWQEYKAPDPDGLRGDSITIEIDEALRGKLKEECELFKGRLTKLVSTLEDFGLKGKYQEQLEALGQYNAIQEKLQSSTTVELSEDEIRLLGRQDEMFSKLQVFFTFNARTDIPKERDGEKITAENLDDIMHSIDRVPSGMRDVICVRTCPDSPIGKQITAQRPGWWQEYKAPDPDGLVEGGYTNDPRNAPGQRGEGGASDKGDKGRKR